MSDSLQNLATLDAVGICQTFALSDEASTQLQATDKVAVLLDKLAAAGHWPDALNLVAYALPKRAAVSWAAQCANTLGDGNGPNQKAALVAAQAWIRAPDDDAVRRVCFTASETAGLDSAAGCAALAAFWSGGSMAPEDAPVVPPAAHLCQHAAACAAMLAGVAKPELSANFYKQFVALGKAIAEGKQPI
ncbi:MAG TPA: hypothetical protein VFW00_11900 [Rhodocyclaceae bacterium]|nr:hypothetical protein [Rhodocyclaceae bacterium]